MIYQGGHEDQLIHRYRYDADNRIEEVMSSTDGFVWSTDATYFYYPHGPLARVELGEYNVQGLDYYYTLQGWLKGVNTPYTGDPGGDGENGLRTGGDAMAFSLGYYQDDYTPIGSGITLSDTRDNLWTRYQEDRGTTEAKGLYNGNISWMSTDLPSLGESDRMQAMVYGYDQLHRIVRARSLSTYGQNGLTRTDPTDKYDTDYSYDANGNLLTLKRNNGEEPTGTLDNLTYSYYEESNKLKNVDGSATENYTYDEIGNLLSDDAEGIDSIVWTPYGKVRAVFKDDNTEVHFRYDASGNRIAKITEADTTIYVRDASGNVMGVYNNKALREQAIYGSSRLGLVNFASKTGYRSLGGKKYELTNHLGNVLAVVSDNIHLDQDSTWTTAINTTDYYPFGLGMDGRTVQDSTYRYGFNTQEKVDEIKGPGNHYTAEYWEYDPSVVHRWNVDPKPNSSISSYAIFQGNPIWYSDHLGDTIRIAGSDGGFMNYSPGMKNDGNNDFASSTINTLNTIFEKEGGKKVLSRLTSSDNVYSILNEGGGAGTVSFGFQKGKNGGGNIKAGSILEVENLSKIEKLGHELFHGYQFERGQDPYTINSEVGANLFGQSLVSGFGGMAPGQDPVATMKYHDASIELLLSNEFDIKQYQQAVSNFKMGSSKNLPTNKYPKGPYRQFPIVNLKKPIISEFFPLLKD